MVSGHSELIFSSFQVMNLLSGSSLHQKILSVGKDSTIDEEKMSTIHVRLYDHPDEEAQAFQFSVEEKLVPSDADTSVWTSTKLWETSIGHPTPETRREIDVNLRMSSVCYVHSTNFINELNSCASDFKQYMSNLAQTIRNAATEIALGIVHRRTEAMNLQTTMDETFGTPGKLSREPTRASFRGANLPLPSAAHSFAGDSRSLERGTNKVRAPAPTPRVGGFGAMESEVEVNLDIVLESPIIVVPRHDRSFEVLVGHLGEITIRNEVLTNHETFLEADVSRIDRVSIRMMDMNLHSLNIDEKYDNYADDSLHLLSHLR